MLNLLIFCLLSFGVYWLSGKSSTFSFMLMLLLELMSVVFISEHPVWYSNLLNGINIFNILANHASLTLSTFVSSFVGLSATLMLLIAPLCSVHLNDSVTIKSNKEDH